MWGKIIFYIRFSAKCLLAGPSCFNPCGFLRVAAFSTFVNFLFHQSSEGRGGPNSWACYMFNASKEKLLDYLRVMCVCDTNTTALIGLIGHYVSSYTFSVALPAAGASIPLGHDAEPQIAAPSLCERMSVISEFPARMTLHFPPMNG